MSHANLNSFPPYVHPDDPARNLAPDVPLMVDGLDWAWMFVWYKEVPDRPGYCVGTDGSFWSRWKRVGRPGGGSTHVLADWVRRRGYVDPDGYVVCNLRPAYPGQRKTLDLHLLILETFFGLRPLDLDSCHNDGNAQNNAITNLRRDTRQSNMDDRARHGRTARSKAKLKESDIPRIMELYRSGMLQREIAEMYGVTHTSIGYILRRQTWKHVEV